MKLTDEKRELVAELRSKFGNVVTRKQIFEFLATRAKDVNTAGVIPSSVKFDEWPHWITNNKSIRAGRGVYNLALLEASTTTTESTESATVEAN